MKEQDLERFQQSSAHSQKKIINKYVESYLNKSNSNSNLTNTSYNNSSKIHSSISPKSSRPSIAPNTNQFLPRKGALKYIDIEDDQGMLVPQTFEPSSLPELNSPPGRSLKKNEAQALWQKMNPSDLEVQSLKQEISELKSMIDKFTSGTQQALHTNYPGLSYGIPYELSFLFSKLVEAGVSESIVAEILTLAKDLLQPSRLKQKGIVEGWVARYILETTQIANKSLGPQLQCFIGPIGSGKTSSLVKLAGHLMIRENKKIAIVTTDTQKVGAVEQMKIYSHILNIPFVVVKSHSDWEKVSRQLSYADYILCDFPSINFKVPREVEFLKNLIPNTGKDPQIHMVLSTLMGEQDLNYIGKNLKYLSVNDVVFTGLDQSSQQGSIYSFSKQFNVGLFGFGLGTKIPEDFEYATKERVLDLIFKITSSTVNPTTHLQPEGAPSL